MPTLISDGDIPDNLRRLCDPLKFKMCLRPWLDLNLARLLTVVKLSLWLKDQLKNVIRLKTRIICLSLVNKMANCTMIVVYNLQDVSQKPPPLFADSDSEDDWFS